MSGNFPSTTTKITSVNYISNKHGSSIKRDACSRNLVFTASASHSIHDTTSVIQPDIFYSLTRASPSISTSTSQVNYANMTLLMHSSLFVTIVLLYTCTTGVMAGGDGVGEAGVASAPKPVCYWKKQKCCFVYGACGYVPKKVTKKVDCPYQKCDSGWKNECYPVPKCYSTQVAHGEECKKVPDGYGWKTVCTPKYVTKQVCDTEQKCEKKKWTKCYSVAAYCLKYLYYEYAKYCAKLSCGDLVLSEGTEAVPKPYVAPEGKLTKTEEGERHDADEAEQAEGK